MAATRKRLAPDHVLPDTQKRPVGGNDFVPDHILADTHVAIVGDGLSNSLPPTRLSPISMDDTSGADTSNELAPDHIHADTQARSVGSKNGTSPDQASTDTQAPNVGAGPSYADLLIWSETLLDLERVRISVENRIRAAEQGNILVDALGLEELKKRVLVDEEYAQKQLERTVRRHPLGPWVKAQKGIGEKQIGRLLGVIGDPYMRGPEFDENGEEVAPSRPRRGPAELWAYCGFHTVAAADHIGNDTQAEAVGGCNVAPRHQRGVQANWNDAARMRAYLIGAQCVKAGAGGPYRAEYDRGREKYENAVHKTPCHRCGPSGKPAAVGSPLSDGHKHARAIRLVAKLVLKNLWIEAKRLHELAPDHPCRDTQEVSVGG